MKVYISKPLKKKKKLYPQSKDILELPQARRGGTS